jgi:hypothetical protein
VILLRKNSGAAVSQEQRIQHVESRGREIVTCGDRLQNFQCDVVRAFQGKRDEMHAPPRAGRVPTERRRSATDKPPLIRDRDSADYAAVDDAADSRGAPNFLARKLIG